MHRGLRVIRPFVLLVVLAVMALGRTGGARAELTPPINLFAGAYTDTQVLFAWYAFPGTTWTCVNLAESYEDLTNGGPTWHNRGCGNTESQLLLSDLKCGTTYYWNVYAHGDGGNATSQWRRTETPECGTGPGIAPIHEAEVFERNGRYLVKVEAGLMDTCMAEGTHDFYLTEDSVRLWVWTFVEPTFDCVAEGRRYEVEVDIGARGDYRPGQTYTVNINDEMGVTFTAA